MSGLVMGALYGRALTKAQRDVAQAYADHASDDGQGAEPSVRRVAWKTGYSVRYVEGIIKELRRLEVLVQTRAPKHHRAPEYAIVPSAVPLRPPPCTCPEADDDAPFEDHPKWCLIIASGYAAQEKGRPEPGIGSVEPSVELVEDDETDEEPSDRDLPDADPETPAGEGDPNPSSALVKSTDPEIGPETRSGDRADPNWGRAQTRSGDRSNRQENHPGTEDHLPSVGGPAEHEQPLLVPSVGGPAELVLHRQPLDDDGWTESKNSPWLFTRPYLTEDGKRRSQRRDLLFEALVHVCRINPAELTKNGREKLNAAVGMIREVGGSPLDILERAVVYIERRINRGRRPTAMGLATNWAECAPDPLNDSVELNAAARRERVRRQLDELGESA